MISLHSMKKRISVVLMLMCTLLLTIAWQFPTFGQEDNIPPTITSGTIFIDDTEFPCADLVSHDIGGPYGVAVHAIDNIGISSVILSYSLSATAPIHVTMGSMGGDYYWGEIPGQAYGTRIFYFVTAYDSAGNFSHYEHPYHDPFITDISPIISEPYIVIEGQEYALTDEDIVITENEGPYTVSAKCHTATGVTSVVLYYTIFRYGQYDDVNVPMSHVADDYYIADIPEQPYGTTIHVYFEATCGVGHTEVCEKSTNDPFIISIVCDPPGGWMSDPLPAGFICGETNGLTLVYPWAEDEEGNKVELFCSNLFEFDLEYLPLGNPSRQIGRCPWLGGINEGEINYAEDNDGDGIIECFYRTFWRSTEPSTDQGEPALTDWKEYEFFPQTATLLLWHFASFDGPGGAYPDILIKEAENVHPLDFNPDPPQGDEPMITVVFAPCDMDRDGDCDTDDAELAKKAIGQCIDGDQYNRLADVDHNGCITGTDFQVLFPVIPVTIDIKPGSDPNCVNPSSKGVVPVALLSTSAIDLSEVNVATIQIDNDDSPATPGVTPSKSYYKKDVDGDGFPDCVFHFSTRALRGLLADGITLFITGELSDGTAIIGSDVVCLAGGPNCF